MYKLNALLKMVTLIFSSKARPQKTPKILKEKLKIKIWVKKNHATVYKRIQKCYINR